MCRFSYTYKLANNNTAVVTTFTDLSFDQNGSIVSWLWDFGDGKTSGSQNPTHDFEAGKLGDTTYTVTLSKTCNGGVSTDIKVTVYRKGGD